MLLGTSANASVKTKGSENEEAVTDAILENLKDKLLSSRDKFILSAKDALPEMIRPKKQTSGDKPALKH